jgi:anti-sigma factor ChrR (cupin superfamily)
MASSIFATKTSFVAVASGTSTEPLRVVLAIRSRIPSEIKNWKACAASLGANLAEDEAPKAFPHVQRANR